MKLMMNGAITLGTLDGANVEICEQVGADNMFLFGMTEQEVTARRQAGYNPQELYRSDEHIRRAVDAMYNGFGGRNYSEIAGSLTGKDPYMVLADFASYQAAQRLSGEVYRRREQWARMALLNTACSGKFSSDRSIHDYATAIWHARPLADG